jgi:hypothetical protein
MTMARCVRIVALVMPLGGVMFFVFLLATEKNKIIKQLRTITTLVRHKTQQFGTLNKIIVISLTLLTHY